MFGNSSVARILMRQRADPEYITPGGWSVLHYLFDWERSSSNTEFFSIFADEELSGDVKDVDGWTSLHRCAAFGTAEDVKLLHFLEAPKCLDRCTTNSGLNPIHVAAMMDNVASLEALTQLHRDQQIVERPHLDALYSVDLNGWTPTHLAAQRGAKTTLKWLLQNGADPHRTTYLTAAWFPEGYEGEALAVKDLAVLSGNDFLEHFARVLEEVGYDITTDGNDVY